MGTYIVCAIKNGERLIREVAATSAQSALDSAQDSGQHVVMVYSLDKQTTIRCRALLALPNDPHPRTMNAFSALHFLVHRIIRGRRNASECFLVMHDRRILRRLVVSGKVRGAVNWLGTSVELGSLTRFCMGAAARFIFGRFRTPQHAVTKHVRRAFDPAVAVLLDGLLDDFADSVGIDLPECALIEWEGTKTGFPALPFGAKFDRTMSLLLEMPEDDEGKMPPLLKWIQMIVKLALADGMDGVRIRSEIGDAKVEFLCGTDVGLTQTIPARLGADAVVAFGASCGIEPWRLPRTQSRLDLAEIGGEGRIIATTELTESGEQIDVIWA